MSTFRGPTIDTSSLATIGAALAVLLTSTALSGVLADLRWVVPVLLTVTVISGTGLLGRRIRWWPPLVILAQLLVLLCLLAMLFSSTALLGVLPGPAAVGELATVLSAALEVVRNGVPPVPADPALQCLVCLGLGLVAILVDTIAVAAGTPAVAGLVLLCVFAIPASLAETMLPWWSFVAGACGFALLLVFGGHRPWQRREERGAVARTVFGQHVAAVGGTAAVIALLTGVAFTGVGTEGRLPGAESAGYGAQTGGIGLRPFTSLRGQLDRDRVVNLFRVRGLPQEAYLRAMTLRKFDPQRGWELDGLTQGVDAQRTLPLPEGTDILMGTPARVEVNPVGYRDPWLPVFGMPLAVTDMGADWRYDPASGIVFTQTRQESRPYVEQLVLPNPSPQQLRDATGPAMVDPAYLDTSGISPAINDLGHRLTAQAPTNFDKAVTLNRYFTDPANGFTYDLETAPPTGGDALSDFLFRGKRGFCEQYASSMAVLLRSVGVPSRVAVGFTSGYNDGGERVITTEDAHAWVEAYFPGWGWITFDPTPLDDGRTSLPPYLNREPPPGQPVAPPPGAPPSSEPPAPGQQPDPGRAEGGDQAAPLPSGEADSGSSAWPAVGFSALALALLAGPASVRELRRRHRLHVIAGGAPGSADTAWREVLDAVWDRGTRPAATETMRKVAANLIARHGLDEEGARAMHALVAAVEREWYAPRSQTADSTIPEALDKVLASLDRSAPLGWRDRVLPRSVLRPGKPA